jgi:hypothetical protein
MTTTTNPTRKASEIGFGIEIECNIPTAHAREFRAGSYHSGNAVNVDGLRDWNVQKDGSVRATNGFVACEVVSPVLYGEAGLIKVVEMLDYLNSIGAQVNASCGLHVHVDVSGLDNAQIKRLVNLFKKYEMAFYDMNGENTEARLSSAYCKPSALWNNTRYQSLNLQHISDARPHIEIRVWQGAMKPETVVAAIYMSVSLVSRTTARATIKTDDITSEPRDVMKKYIKRFMTGATMIVPDYNPHDIWREMLKAASTSNRNR